MDELNEFVVRPVRRRGRPPKGTPKVAAKRSLDEGLGSSLASLDDSIAQSVKRHKRGSNDKQFDTKFFFNSVVDRIENKYRHTRNDPIIDVNNLEIINDNDIGSKRNRKIEFGFFAENTLEDLRQNSFRDRRLMSCPLTASSSSSASGTPPPPPSRTYTRKASKTNSKYNNSRAVQVRSMGSVAPRPKPSLTEIAIASDDSDAVSDSMSNDGNVSLELDDHHPLVVYDNKILWNDEEYQKRCLDNCIELLRKDKNNHFKDALKERARQTLNLGGLPSSPTIVPIIHFNAKGEPNFDFYFLAPNSPQNASEALKINSDIIYKSRTIYETICYDPDRQRRTSNRISYSTKRKIDFDYY